MSSKSCVVRCVQFPMSDISVVMSKVKQIIDASRLNELSGYGALAFEDFRQMMENVSQGRLTDQEIITLARYNK